MCIRTSSVTFFVLEFFKKKGRNSEKKQKQQVISANFENFLAPQNFQLLNKGGFLPVKGKKITMLTRLAWQFPARRR